VKGLRPFECWDCDFESIIIIIIIIIIIKLLLLSAGKRPLGRPRYRWVHNTEMGVVKVGYGGVDWIRLAQDRYRWRALVNAVINLRVP
jgi:hypothetical protein